MIKDKLAKKIKIPGFGHRVYHTTDPRAASLKGMAKELGERTGPQHALPNFQRKSKNTSRKTRA